MGDLMKKYLVVILLAIVSGSILAFFTFKNYTVDALSKRDAYLFQVGVFKSEKNALKRTNSFSSSIMILENDYYHVYTHIFTNKSLAEIIKKYYDENDIKYYLKKIVIDENLYEEISEYQELLLDTNDIEKMNKSSQNLLNIYKNYMEISNEK